MPETRFKAGPIIVIILVLMTLYYLAVFKHLM